MGLEFDNKNEYAFKLLLFASIPIIMLLLLFFLTDKTQADDWIETTTADFNDGIFQNTRVVLDDVRLGENVSWLHRRPINITGSENALTNYPVKINVSYNADMQADFDDIRFTLDDGNTSIDYWRETYVASSYALFWVKVPSIPASPSNTTIYMYYGNSSAVSESSSSAVFGKSVSSVYNRDNYYVALILSNREWITGGTSLNIKGDDVGASRTLPSPVKVYGTSVSGVYLNTNGLLRWDNVTDNTYANSLNTTKKVLTAHWDDLYISTTYRNDANIYEIIGSDAVGWYIAYRWATTYYASKATSADFEILLYENGSIQFNIYGLWISATPNEYISKGDSTNYIDLTPRWKNMESILLILRANPEPTVTIGSEENLTSPEFPYHSSGTYISSNKDTGANDAIVLLVSWNVTGITLTMEVAAGNSPNPTNWESVTNGDTSIAVIGRYLRYRATFSGSGLTDEPKLNDTTIVYNHAPNTINLRVEGFASGTSGSLNITDHTPDLSWSFSDVNPGDTQGGYNVSVWTGSGGTGTLMGFVSASGTSTTWTYSGSALLDGNDYYLRVRTYDNHGFWSDWAGMKFHMNSLPTVFSVGVQGFLVAPDILNITDHTPDINWSYVDTEEAQTNYNVSVWTDADRTGTLMGYINTSGSSKVWTYSGIALADGKDYYANVQVKDGYEWSNWAEIKFHMNSLPTVFSVGVQGFLIPPDILNITDHTPDINWSYNDSENDQTDCSVAVWTGSMRTGTLMGYINTSASSKVWTYSGFALADSQDYYVNVQVKDGYEWSSWLEAKFHMNSLPYTTLISPQNDTWINDSTPLFKWSYIDFEGSEQCAFNISISSSRDFSNVTYYINQTSNNNSLELIKLPEGIWYWRVKVYDGYEWSGLVVWRIVKIDVTVPYNPIKLLSESHIIFNWSNDNTIEISWYGAFDAVSGIRGYSFAWDTYQETIPDDTIDCEYTIISGSSFPLADGISWYFHIRTVDNASNWNNTAFHLGPFYIDTFMPNNPVVLSSSHQTSKWYNNNVVNISWSGASDILNNSVASGIRGYAWEWSNDAYTIPNEFLGSNATVTNITTMLLDGTWYFHIRTVDNAGNWNNTAFHLGPFYIDTFMPNNPVVSSNSHQTSKWYNNNVVNISWSGADDILNNSVASEIKGYSWEWSDSPYATPDEIVEADYTVTNLTGALPDGVWYFHIRTFDNAGNCNSTTIHFGPFLIDTKPPTNLSILINGGAKYTNSINVNSKLSASDLLSGVWQMCFSTNGFSWTDWESFSLSKPWVLQQRDGVKFLYFKVRDKAGNENFVISEIILDTVPPEKPIVHSFSNPSGLLTSNNKPVFFWLAPYDLNGIDGYSFVLDTNEKTNPHIYTKNNYTLYENISVGTWYFHLRAKDKAGNWGEVYHYKFTIIPELLFELPKKTYVAESFKIKVTTIEFKRFYYFFDFGDGTNSGWVNDSVVKHSYSKPKKYELRAKVKDENGIESDWVYETVTIKEPEGIKIPTYALLWLLPLFVGIFFAIMIGIMIKKKPTYTHQYPKPMSTPQYMERKKCYNCGKQTSGLWNACPYCGARLI